MPPTLFAAFVLKSSALPARSQVVRADRLHRDATRATAWLGDRLVFAVPTSLLIAAELFPDQAAAHDHLRIHQERGVGGSTLNVTEMGTAPHLPTRSRRNAILTAIPAESITFSIKE